jgi:hypothetical protein
MNVNLRPYTLKTPRTLQLPVTAGPIKKLDEDGFNEEEDNNTGKRRKMVQTQDNNKESITDDMEVEKENEALVTPLNKNLITFSNAPRPTWITLYNLETVRVRMNSFQQYIFPYENLH